MIQIHLVFFAILVHNPLREIIVCLHYQLLLGANFGDLNSLHLPTLTLLEKLLIQRVRLFTHVAKFSHGKDGEIAMKHHHHVLAVPVDGPERFGGFIERVAGQRQRLPVPDPKTCGLSVVFIGGFPKLSNAVGAQDLIQ